MQNITTSGLFRAKSQFSVGKLLSFLNDLLEVFFGFNFFTLSFFRNVQKKPGICEYLRSKKKSRHYKFALLNTPGGHRLRNPRPEELWGILLSL